MATQYRKPDGTFTTDSRYAQRVAPWDIVGTWLKYSSLSPRLVLGSALHETGYTVNERDPGDQGDGSNSDGLLQISDAEKRRVGYPDADLFDLDDNLMVYAALMDGYAAELRRLAPGKEGTSDFLYYLALAHNQGLDAARKTIAAHGMSAATYTQNNQGTVKPGFNGPKIVAYYSDAASGGRDYNAAWDQLSPAPSSGGALASIVKPVGVGVLAFLALREILRRM